MTLLDHEGFTIQVHTKYFQIEKLIQDTHVPSPNSYICEASLCDWRTQHNMEHQRTPAKKSGAKVIAPCIRLDHIRSIQVRQVRT